METCRILDNLPSTPALAAAVTPLRGTLNRRQRSGSWQQGRSGTALYQGTGLRGGLALIFSLVTGSGDMHVTLAVTKEVCRSAKLDSAGANQHEC